MLSTNRWVLHQNLFVLFSRNKTFKRVSFKRVSLKMSDVFYVSYVTNVSSVSYTIVYVRNVQCAICVLCAPYMSYMSDVSYVSGVCCIHNFVTTGWGMLHLLNCWHRFFREAELLLL